MEFNKKVIIIIPSFQFSIIPFPAKAGKIVAAKSNIFKNKSQEQNKVLDFFYFYYYFQGVRYTNLDN